MERETRERARFSKAEVREWPRPRRMMSLKLAARSFQSNCSCSQKTRTPEPKQAAVVPRRTMRTGYWKSRYSKRYLLVKLR